MKTVFPRRSFLSLSAGALASQAIPAAAATAASSLKLRFLGTGAADWNGRDARGEWRRLTSAFVEDRVLIDFTPGDRDMLPAGASPRVVFYTHSHGDHYDPAAAVQLGIERAYVHESWAEGARREFAAAAAKCRRPCPEVVGLAFGEVVEAAGLRFMSLPANHVTNRPGERTSFYLVEKGAVRLLYATDTGGIPGEAARLVGIDAHVRPGKPITALVMEATMGVDHADDFRIYSHSSVATVAQTVRVLTKTKRYCPAPGQCVYLTHMARTLHGTQAEVEAAVPAPLKPAYDGLEVVFTA